MKKLATLTLALVLAACGNKGGGEFEGKWIDGDRGTEMLTIERNGGDFRITVSNPKRPNAPPDTPSPAVLKDGKLVMGSQFGETTYTVSDRDSLVFTSPVGSAEYRRVK